MEEQREEFQFLNAQRILRGYAQRGDILYGERVDQFLQKFAAHILEQVASREVRSQIKPGMSWNEMVALLPDMLDFVAAKASIVPIKELSYSQIAEIALRDLKGQAKNEEIDWLCSCYEYLDTWRRILVERRHKSESRIEKMTADLEVARCEYEGRKELNSLKWRRLQADTKVKIANERAVVRGLIARQGEVKYYRQVLTQKLARAVLDGNPLVYLKESDETAAETVPSAS